MPFTGIPGTKLSTPGNIVPGSAGYMSTIAGSIVFTASTWQGGIGVGFPYETTAYVSVPISAVYTNGNTYDPTGDVVQFAFIGPYGTTQQAADYPPNASTVWTNGAWNTSAATSTAVILVGQVDAAITLAVGSYQVWVRVIDNPEQPVLWCGPMIVS